MPNKEQAKFTLKSLSQYDYFTHKKKFDKSIILGIDLPEECFEDYEPHTEQKKRQTFKQKQHQMEIMDPESGDFVPMDGKNYLKFSEDTLQK